MRKDRAPSVLDQILDVCLTKLETTDPESEARYASAAGGALRASGIAARWSRRLLLVIGGHRWRRERVAGGPARVSLLTKCRAILQR
jgi:hypothetical protein